MIEKRFAIYSDATNRLGTNLYESRELAKSKCDKSRRVVMVLLSDGIPVSRRGSEKSAAQAAKISERVNHVGGLLAELARLRDKSLHVCDVK